MSVPKHIRFSFQQISKMCNSKRITQYGRSYNTHGILEKNIPPLLALRDPSKIKVLRDDEIEKFRSFFPHILNDLTNSNMVTEMDEVRERLKAVLQYNITTGKQIRPALLIAAYKFILGDDTLTDEEFQKVALIAWCIEMISSYILMMDDIIDNSDTRRGKRAWFKLENVGLRAINDGTLIQMSVFKLLEKYFAHHEYYHDILKVFIEVITKTFVGQVMDCEEWCFGKSTMERFNNIAYNKTGYYTFYFPLVIAMYLAERPDLALDKEGFEVFMDLGRFYQLQNDFLDVYGESFSGKLGTDIQEGKYSWLIIKAIEKASPVQSRILKNCYGRWDNDCVEQVKLVFNELDLKNTFHEEVEDIYKAILTSLSEMKSEVAAELMFGVTRVCLGYDFHLGR